MGFKQTFCTNKVFDIIAVNETRITRQTYHNTIINLRDYVIEFTPTDFTPIVLGSAGGTLL